MNYNTTPSNEAIICYQVKSLIIRLLGDIREKPRWLLQVDVYAAKFATKSPGNFLMQVTAIVLCVGDSMVQCLLLMPISIQTTLNGSREKTF